MHEISLVRNIFRTLESQFSEGELSGLSEIKLRVGLLSNVEPILLQNAFQAVLETEQQQHSGVKLAIETVPIRIQCPDCAAISEITNYHFICSACQKPTNNIISGTELLIAGVEL